MIKCAECSRNGCQENNLNGVMTCCPSKNDGIQAEARKLYDDPENYKLAHNAALVESEGYGKLCRMEEIMLFCRKCGFRKLGLIFCVGLSSEAREVSKILTHNGFEVVSAACKNGVNPKSMIGIKDEETISGCADEVMCNPIGQALFMNAENTEFNIILGLCVGHDSLVMKYLKAPATILAVKDRVTGHNPIAAVYMAESYYKKRFFGENDGLTQGKKTNG